MSHISNNGKVKTSFKLKRIRKRIGEKYRFFMYAMKYSAIGVANLNFNFKY